MGTVVGEVYYFGEGWRMGEMVSTISTLFRPVYICKKKKKESNARLVAVDSKTLPTTKPSYITEPKFKC